MAQPIDVATFRAAPLPGVTLLRARYLRHRFDRHVHDTYAVGVTTSGVQAFRCRGADHASTAGHLLAFNPDEPHDGHAVDGHDFAYWMLYVEPAALPAIIGSGAGLPLFRSPVVAAPGQATRLLEALASLGPQESLAGQTLLSASLAEVFGAHAGARLDAAPRRSPPAARRMREVVEAEYARDLTGEALARAAGCTRVHAIRIFTAAFGVPPHVYLNAVRLRHARALVRAGLPLGEVALACGFADQAHFTRRFTRSVGVAPGRWRAMLCGGPHAA